MRFAGSKPALATARHRVPCGHAQPSLRSSTRADAPSVYGGSQPVVPCDRDVKCSSAQESEASLLSARTVATD
eukprot:4581440-Prymnesium_polylepis.1